MALTRHFTEHPASVGETYGEHFRVAVGFAADLLGAAAACAVHAVVPALCTRTASAKIDELHARVHAGARGRLAAETAETAELGRIDPAA